jgi:hypothetical protein
MLQFPVQYPPLDRPSKDTVHPNDASPARAPLSLKHGLRPAALQSTPLSVTTNFSPSSSPSPPSTSVKPRSPYISSRKILTPVSASSPMPWQSISPGSGSRPASIASSSLEGVLEPGDIVGEGCKLQDDTIRLVSSAADCVELAKEFEVVKQLGTGSYAVVYQVREVLSRPPPSEDGHMPLMGSMELNGELSRSASVQYGREYAMKCLSKADLDEADLAAQMSEVRMSSYLLIAVSYAVFLGHNSPVTSITSQYRYSSPHLRDLILLAASAGVRSGRGPLLFFGTSPRSLRIRIATLRFFSFLLSHSPHSQPPWQPKSIAITVSY